jgi:hypothetical protein
MLVPPDSEENHRSRRDIIKQAKNIFIIAKLLLRPQHAGIFLIIFLFVCLSLQRSHNNVLGAKVFAFSPTFTPTPTLTPTATPTPTPTNTPTPTPTNTPTPKPTMTPTKTPTPTPKPPPPAPDYLNSLFDKYSSDFKVDSNILRKIANCESHYNPGAASGDYGGMFQYMKDTWINTRTQMGLDTNPDLRFNAEESIRTTAFKIANGGLSAWRGCL